MDLTLTEGFSYFKSTIIRMSEEKALKPRRDMPERLSAN